MLLPRNWTASVSALKRLPRAALAIDAHVGQEAHLDLLEPLALAAFATPARRVEREPARVVAAQARFGRRGEQLADLVEDADVGRGARARRLADRRLVDLEHAADALPTLQALEMRQFRGLTAARSDAAREIVLEHVAQQRALAAAADARHADEPRERQRNVEPAQIVALDAFELEPAPSRARRSCASCDARAADAAAARRALGP